MSEELDVLNMLLGQGNKFQETQLAQNKMQSSNNLKNIVETNRLIANENAQNLKIKKDLLEGEYKANYSEIEKLNNSIQLWNINAVDWSALNDEDTTKDGEDLLKTEGWSLGENMQIRVNVADNQVDQMNYYTNAIEEQRNVIDELKGYENELTNLYTHWQRVGVSAGTDFIKDIKDVQVYMSSSPELREKFGIDENLFNAPVEEGGAGGKWQNYDFTSLNPLGMAFQKEREGDGTGATGFITQPTNIELKRAGINPETMVPLKEEQAGDTKGIVIALKNAINIAKERDDDSNVGEGKHISSYTSDYFDDLNFDRLEALLTDKNIYSSENQKTLEVALDTVSDAIFAMLEKNVSSDHQGKVGRSDAENEELKRAFGFDLVEGDYANRDPEVRKMILDSIVDRYIGQDTHTEVNQDTGQTTLEFHDRAKVPYGKLNEGATNILNKAYYDDKIYHGQKPRGMDAGWFMFDKDEVVYGSTDHDLVFAHLLQFYQEGSRLANWNKPNK